MHSESCWCHCSPGKGKTNPSPASFIMFIDPDAQSDFCLQREAKILGPQGQYFKIAVRLLPCGVKPSYIYLILKPHFRFSSPPRVSPK